MSRASLKSLAFFLTLALWMATTRFSHVGTPWSLPDASWAVFFLGGFYLTRAWRWALPLLILETVALDFEAIRDSGVSGYSSISNDCLTAAYGFIVPAYGLLWLGGGWLRQHYRHELRDLLPLAASLLLSVSACYLLTNGSFYWLGGGVSHTSVGGWLRNLTDWYGHFVGIPCMYVAVAALLHVIVVRRSPGVAAWTTR
jgi:hypothetical protein